MKKGDQKLKGRGRERKKQEIRESHPIMTSKHEVVSPKSPIPERVSYGDHSDIISNKMPERGEVVRQRLVKVLDHHGHAEGHEVNVSQLGIPCSKPPHAVFQLVYEPPFNGVDVLARPVMAHWRLSLRVHVYLESSLHLPIAPVHTKLHYTMLQKKQPGQVLIH